MDVELAKTQGGLHDGKSVKGVPKKTAISLYGEYDMPWVEDLTLTGRVIYTGSSYYDRANTQKVSDWTRVNLGARARKRQSVGIPGDGRERFQRELLGIVCLWLPLGRRTTHVHAFGFG